MRKSLTLPGIAAVTATVACVRRGSRTGGLPPDRRRLAMLVGVALTGLGAVTPAAAAANCPDAPLRPTLEGVYPAGCYVYEKVSPSEKGNGEVAGGAMITGFRSSVDGNRVMYAADGAFLGATSFPQFNGYLGDRQADGWAGVSVTARLPFYDATDYFNIPEGPFDYVPTGLSDDGRKTVVGTNRDPETGAHVPNRIYVVDVVSGEVERISPDPVAGDPFVTLDSIGGARFRSAGSDDYSHAYISSQAQLTADSVAPAVPAHLEKVYHYHDGVTQLASWSPSGQPIAGEMVNTRASAPLGPNGVSADGSVYWFASDISGVTYRLYRGEAGVKQSTFVTESENGNVVVPPGPAEFKGASRDGSRVVFASNQNLTEDATGNTKIFLYTHSDDPGNDTNLTLISSDEEPADATVLQVRDVWGVSDDARTVYFSTTGKQLVEGAPLGPGDKLYRWHEGELTYLLTASVNPLSTQSRATMTSPDGRFFAFTSPSGGITADNNGGNAQQYLYDAYSDEFFCTSCLRGGINASAVSYDRFYNRMQVTNEPRRWLSSDGRTFFETDERLLEQDTNGVRDLYTWKGGKLQLISTGRSTSESRLADASVDGSTVFFITRERLSAWDTDSDMDLYAARLDGGVPEPADRPAESCAVGADCQGQASPSPGLPTIGSLGFVGGGNVRVPPASGSEEARKVSVKRPNTVRGTRVSLSVRAPQAGSIRVSGAGLRRTTKTAKRAKTYRVTVTLSKRAKRTLRRTGRVTIRATVRFTPKRGRYSQARTSVTFMQKRTGKVKGRSHKAARVSTEKGGR